MTMKKQDVVKGKVEETDKVALKIKQEVLKKGEIIPSTPSQDEVAIETQKSYDKLNEMKIGGVYYNDGTHWWIDTTSCLEAISKAHSACMKESGFKDADEEMAKLQDEYEKALLQTALRKYKEGYNQAVIDEKRKG